MKKDETSRIGVHCWGVNPDSVKLLGSGVEAGAHWVRATRPMQWDTITTGEPRGYDFARGGEYSIDRAVELGMSIVGILDARWGNETLHNDLPFASPVWEHLDLWRNFVCATVAHYKDRVKYWEVLNEPPFFWWYPTPEGITVPEADCPIVRAPISRYVELLAATADAVRSTDPSAHIVVGSGFSDGAFLEQVYRHGGRDYFDIASVHYISCDRPDKFAMAMRRLRAVMAAYGDAGKPLWDTESGPGGAVIGHEVITPQDYESQYNVYRHCLAHEFGLDRYFWFNATHKGDGMSSPYRAMETLYDLVGEGALIRSRHSGDEAHGYAFAGPSGPVTVVWSTAPAVLHAPRSLEGVTHLGSELVLRGERALNGAPIWLYGDVLDAIDLEVTGKRTAVIVSLKQPGGECPTIAATRLPDGAPADDAFWSRLPFAAKAATTPMPTESTHFAKVPTSVLADVRIAYDDRCLLLRIDIADKLADPGRPRGCALISIRDSDPTRPEWPYFTNGYCLLALFASATGPKVMRYESFDYELLPNGPIAQSALTVTSGPSGYSMESSVPWEQIGPCRPGRNNPFLMMMTFLRADNGLDVPDGDEPEEWSHNFVDPFIVKQPAVSRWVVFG